MNSLKQDRRGGKRENAGRKAIWKNKDTITTEDLAALSEANVLSIKDFGLVIA